MLAVDAHVKVEHLLPHGREIDEVPLLAGVLLRDLHLHGLVGLHQAAEERRNRLLGLKVDRAFLGLDNHVVGELAVEGVEDVVRSAGAVGPGIAPVKVVVVDEGAVEDYAMVGREGAGQQVGRISGRAAVARGPGLSFRIGFYGEAGEVRDERVDFVDLCSPPRLYRGIEGVVGGKTSDLLRAGDVNAKRQVHPPRTHGVGYAGQTAEHVSR